MTDRKTRMGGQDDLLFRAMTLDDIPTIVQIEHEAFTSPWSEEAFRTELTQNLFARYIVMERDGVILGYGGMWIIVDEAHITNIAVQEAYRGLGLGERLLREMMRTAVWLEARRMTLEVRVTNEHAKSLYRKLGFQASGVRPGYYSDNREDAIIMWAELESGADEAAGASEGDIE